MTFLLGIIIIIVKKRKKERKRNDSVGPREGSTNSQFSCSKQQFHQRKKQSSVAVFFSTVCELCVRWSYSFFSFSFFCLNLFF